MSQSDSFIEEVTDAVRRDRLFALMRRWAWLAVLLVVLLVGGAAFREWRLSNARTAAEARGDALLTAVEARDADAVMAVSAEGPGASRGGAPRGRGGGGPPRWRCRAWRRWPPILRCRRATRDLAVLRSVLLEPDAPIGERRGALEAIAAPGAPYRLLAEEQLALLSVEEGDTDAALRATRGDPRGRGGDGGAALPRTTADRGARRLARCGLSCASGAWDSGAGSSPWRWRLLSACTEREVILPGERLDLRAPLDGTARAGARGARARSRSPPQQAVARWTHTNGTPEHRVPAPPRSAPCAESPGRRPSAWATPGATGSPRRPWWPMVGCSRSTRSRGVMAHDLSGRALWRTSLTPPLEQPTDASGGGLAYDGGTLYVTTAFGQLAALDAATGAQRWVQRLGAAGPRHAHGARRAGLRREPRRHRLGRGNGHRPRRLANRGPCPTPRAWWVPRAPRCRNGWRCFPSARARSWPRSARVGCRRGAPRSAATGWASPTRRSRTSRATRCSPTTAASTWATARVG